MNPAALKKRAAPLQGGKGSLALAAGKTIGDEAGFKDRLNNIAQSMMNDSVPEPRRFNLAAFGVIDLKFPVRPMAINTFTCVVA
ncbi:MAG: hypothetical protein AAB359_04140 [Elusimicrobiota bacterium]